MKRRGLLRGVAAAIAFVSAAASGFGATVVNVCSKTVPAKRRIILPPIPKWNNLTDDIDGLDYRKRSEDFERSLLPKDLVFPREGQIWELVRDCEVWGHTPVNNRLAITKVQLSKGERVRILPLPHPQPLQVRFQRLRPDDAGSALSIQTARTIPGQTEANAYFDELFRLVQG